MDTGLSQQDRWRAVFKRSRLQIIGISMLHALIVLIFTLFLINLSFVGEGQTKFFRNILTIKRLLFNIDDKPSPSEFLFLNVSYDRQLIDKQDQDGFLIGNQDITDRKKLTQLLRILNQHPDAYKFMLCGVFFADSSPDDTELRVELGQMTRFLIPYHLSEPPPVFDVPRGLVDYTTAEGEGTFLKFQFITTHNGQGYETLPLLMYKQLHKAVFQPRLLLSVMNGRLCLNSVILDFRIRNYDLFSGTYRQSYLNLGELLLLPDEGILEMTQDRIIVIGDFTDRDLHETIFGTMPGCLILINAYLALVNGDNILSPYFLLVLFAMYVIMSYNIFYNKNLKERTWNVKLFQMIKVGDLIAEWLSYMFIMGGLAIVLSFIFHLHVNIMLTATYFMILETGVHWWRKGRQGVVTSCRRLLKDTKGGNIR